MTNWAPNVVPEPKRTVRGGAGSDATSLAAVLLPGWRSSGDGTVARGLPVDPFVSDSAPPAAAALSSRETTCTVLSGAGGGETGVDRCSHELHGCLEGGGGAGETALSAAPRCAGGLPSPARGGVESLPAAGARSGVAGGTMASSALAILATSSGERARPPRSARRTPASSEARPPLQSSTICRCAPSICSAAAHDRPSGCGERPASLPGDLRAGGGSAAGATTPVVAAVPVAAAAVAAA